MNLTKQNKFILAIALQLIIIAGIIIFKFSIISNGTNVLLKIMPVDPRDPFRGDYITFQYDITNLEKNFFTYSPNNGDTVYVPLRKSGKYWRATYGIDKKINLTKNYVYIKAKVISGGNSDKVSPTFFNGRNNNTEVRVKYGIEEYFIPEGAGRNVNFWNKQAHAVVVVDDNGNAVLKQIFLNDSPWP